MQATSRERRTMFPLISKVSLSPSHGLSNQYKLFDVRAFAQMGAARGRIHEGKVTQKHQLWLRRFNRGLRSSRHEQYLVWRLEPPANHLCQGYGVSLAFWVGGSRRGEFAKIKRGRRMGSRDHRMLLKSLKGTPRHTLFFVLVSKEARRYHMSNAESPMIRRTFEPWLAIDSPCLFHWFEVSYIGLYESHTFMTGPCEEGNKVQDMKWYISHI